MRETQTFRLNFPPTEAQKWEFSSSTRRLLRSWMWRHHNGKVGGKVVQKCRRHWKGFRGVSRICQINTRLNFVEICHLLFWKGKWESVTRGKKSVMSKRRTNEWKSKKGEGEMGGDCCWIVRHIRRLLSAEDEQQKIPWKFTILLDRLCQLQSEQSDDVRMRKGRRRRRRFGIRIPPVLAQMKGKFYFNFTLLLFHRHGIQLYVMGGRRRSRSSRNNHHPLQSLSLSSHSII